MWKQVRYDDTAGVVIVGRGDDERVIHNTGADELMAHLDDLGPASATALRRALQASGLPVLVVEGDYEEFDYEFSQGGPVTIRADDEDLLVEVVFETDAWGDPDVVRDRTRRLLDPLMRRSRCRFVDAEMDPGSAAYPWQATATLAPLTRGRAVSEVYTIGVEAEALLSAAAGGELTRSTTLDVLRAGHANVILGLQEGQRLDVKRQDYDLSGDRGRISLAQDVARFANAEKGGLVVIGFETKKRRGSETITKITPVHPPASGTARHVQAVDQRVFPPVNGLTVEEVDVDGGVLVIINVPPQPEELKPFLVHGAIVNGKVEGAFISILRRRGEDSIPITPQSIHSTLAAGRALLRRGEAQGP